MVFDPLSGLDPTGQAALLSSIATSRGTPLFGFADPSVGSIFPSIPQMPRRRAFRVPMVGESVLPPGTGGGGGEGGVVSSTTTSVNPLATALSTLLGFEAARTLANPVLGMVGAGRVPGTIELASRAIKPLWSMLTSGTGPNLGAMSSAEGLASYETYLAGLYPELPAATIRGMAQATWSPAVQSAGSGLAGGVGIPPEMATSSNAISDLAAFKATEALPGGVGVGAGAAAEAASPVLQSTGTFVGPALDAGITGVQALGGATALAPLVTNAIAGRTGEGAVAQNVSAMLAAALALSGNPIAALGVGVLGTLGGLLFGQEKPSAQKRWQHEQQGNRVNFATAMSQAESLPDIAEIFNTYGGRNYRPVDVVQPGFLSSELGGELFNQAAGGSSGNIAAYSLFDALRRLAPAANVAQAKEFVAGYGRPSRAALVEQARASAENEGLAQLFNPSSVPAPKGRFQEVWENLEQLPAMPFPDIEGASPEPLFNIWKRSGAPGFNMSYRQWLDQAARAAQAQANAAWASGVGNA